MSIDNKNAYGQEKIKKERNRKQRPRRGDETRNNNALTTTEDNTQTINFFSPKITPLKKKQYTSVVVARSKILSFHHGERLNWFHGVYT
jgi:hypothetical protein